jgi:hypothetical protein
MKENPLYFVADYMPLVQQRVMVLTTARSIPDHDSRRKLSWEG